MKKKISDKMFFFLILFSWLSLLLSINSKPEEIIYFGDGFFNSINAIRIATPFIVTIFLSLYIFSNIKFLYLKKLPLIFFVWLLYFLLQGMGFVLEINEFTSYISSLYLLIFSITVLEIIYLIKKKTTNFRINYLMLVLVIVLACVFFLYFFYYLNSTNIFVIQDRFDLYYLIDPDSYFMNQTGPRITGLSRTCSIVAIFLLIIFFYKNFKNNIKILVLLSLTILSFLVWYMQSRGTILCYYFSILFIIFFIKKIYLKKKLFFVSLLIILPIASNYFYFNVSKKNLELEKEKISNQNESRQVIQENSRPRIIENKTDSGRFFLWSELLKSYDFKKVFGYGPQADRLLLKGETNSLGITYGNNASNGFIYAFICGGYLGLLCYILINIQILIFIYKCVIINKIFIKNEQIYIKLSIAYLLFFFIRQFFENSFSLFSIDYLIVIISCFIAEEFLKKNHK
jgi:O-antigen ligase